MQALIQSILKRRFCFFLRVLPIAPTALILLISTGTALAAPSAATSTVYTAPAHAHTQSGAASKASIPQSQKPPTGGPQQPTCDQGTDANGCAKQLTTKLGTTAQAIFQVGIWVAVVVAVLVVVWTTPAGIFAATSNNSKVLSQVVMRLGLIAALVLLAINSWTILQWFLGAQGNSITAPTFPGISN